jgi:hypothetical protein
MSASSLLAFIPTVFSETVMWHFNIVEAQVLANQPGIQNVQPAETREQLIEVCNFTLWSCILC